MNARDLEVGDVLLKQYHGGLIHWAIKIATGNEGASSTFVHAAMYTGAGEIAESIGSGYSFTPLMAQNHNFTYFVFRNRDAGLAEIAAQVMSTWVRMRPKSDAKSEDRVPGYSGGKGFGKYGAGQAIAGAVRNRLDRDVKPVSKSGEALWGAKDKPGVQSSYCSQFVVQAYSAAGATMQPQVVPIAVAADRATPAMLHDVLLRDGHWQFVGSFVCT
jgi:hypothetical protein